MINNERKQTAMKSKKQRLDLLIVERGILPSRKEAQTAIMDGWVLVNGEKTTKAGTNIDTDAEISLKSGFKKKEFVSRGGLKLEKALKEFNVSVEGRICLDLGASTGGFTDCLLKRGAAKVYAVDVGYGQLDWSLRTDPRVILKERQNARYLTPEILYGEDDIDASFACIDCSFISLTKIIPVLPTNLKQDASSQAICLVKPQFEAGKAEVGKGVVRDPKVHLKVLESIASASEASGLIMSSVTYSPIKGPSGNIEYLVLLDKQGPPIGVRELLETLVEEAFSVL